MALGVMPGLTRRFVLSARPGHDAETKFQKDQRYCLRELTVADAERFICQRLDLLAGRDGDVTGACAS